jgi:predicted RNase H-like nuclease (RuvC/YqgF family)
MKIGDKVRFLNDVGGGKVTGFRPGGIVLVEDEDGFDMPVPQNEVVVIEEAQPRAERKVVVEEKRKMAEQKVQQSLDGREYLQSKTVKAAEESETDEQLEARVVRLEMTVQKMETAMQQMETKTQKLESNLALLEAKFNLQKNGRTMAKKPQQQQHPQSTASDIKTPEIL